ncbi:hypothetical protein GCM10010193_69430 [Kitasatospora atroaurantiaca]|uniref:Uncharacterized protein n=1 Tax=Kitasatospora atroaurantiaca TaxID=285545 RepID=A0A561EN44_9ACTN|nr:hypothetical protein [Kitasatospora atroaurantiaca]TWE17030.1 hypothetical protein FB465_2034 [Kitasatospora atroaurantiaca]
MNAPALTGLALVLAAVCIVLPAVRAVRRAKRMRPVPAGQWLYAQRFAPCAGPCGGEQPHHQHRDGSVTCQQCSTTSLWSPV